MSNLRLCGKTNLLALLIIWGFIPFHDLIAQRSLGALSHLPLINSSVRSLALSEATAALDGYPGAAHINPATNGVDGFYQFQTNLNYTQNDKWLLERNVGPYAYQFNPGISYRSGKMAYTISLQLLDFGRAPLKEDNDLNLYAGGNYQVAPGLRIGAGLNYYRFKSTNIYSVSGDKEHIFKAISLDLGAYYQREYNFADELVFKPSAGLSLTDFGTMYKENNDAIDKQPLLMMMRGGLNMTLESSRQFFDRPFMRLSLFGQLSKELIDVDTTGKAAGAFEALFSSWGDNFVYNGQNYSRISPWQQIDRHSAIEFSILNILSLRYGLHKSYWRYQYAKHYSWGFGIDLFYVALDYAQIKYDRTEYIMNRHSFWQITGRIPFGKHPENFWPKFLNLTNRGGSIEMKR